MRIFKNRYITRFAAKQGITDADLREAAERADNGLIDADLGGGVIKQRIARKGQGRNGGYRSLIIFRKGDKAFFMLAFAKNNRANISREELAELKAAAEIMLAMTDTQIAAAIENSTLTEIEP
ncbi:toxin-antitoxin system, toxin component, RelE family [Neisseria sp. oral taxon 020 str. F0370]|uniref:type II toxin-antitoxin system RelE/ParE family toxin n=1 Tax=unclassified Neisseria TaxID=2623750 RepID=UPI0002A354FE|nr:MULTISPECIES: type II toxin-antitoxin system RelE/ParE family toxin [unclassified Neisseria]ASP17712.1 addiction module toxin RelE [Neisseria sp. KEM232]EKY07824.1 toxin-antitoxin system, toxin component, RelE family [Neisseria sp. oral taxon 020 str. F0370]